MRKKAAGIAARRQVCNAILLELSFRTQEERTPVHIVESCIGVACTIVRQGIGARVDATLCRRRRCAVGGQGSAGRESGVRAVGSSTAYDGRFLVEQVADTAPQRE